MTQLYSLFLAVNPMGFPDWYFQVLGGVSAPGYQAIITMQEKMLGVSKVLFLVNMCVSVIIVGGVWIAKHESILKEASAQIILVGFLLLINPYLFSQAISLSSAVSEMISSQEDREEYAQTLRDKAQTTSQNPALPSPNGSTAPAPAKSADTNSSWSVFGGLLGAVVNVVVGAATIPLSGLIVALAGICFLLVLAVVQALWIVLVIALYCFGPLLVVMGMIPRWGGRVLTAYVNAVITLCIWNIWNGMCIWLMWVTSALFISTTGVTGGLSSGQSMTTGASTVVYTLLLAFGPFLINSFFPLSGYASAGRSQLRNAARSSVRGGMILGRSGGSGGSGGGGSNENSGGGNTASARVPSRPAGSGATSS